MRTLEAIVLCQFGSTFAALQVQFAAKLNSAEKQGLVAMLSAGGYYQSTHRGYASPSYSKWMILGDERTVARSERPPKNVAWSECGLIVQIELATSARTKFKFAQGSTETRCP